MYLTIGQDFETSVDGTTGDGAVSTSNGIKTFSSGAGTGSAYTDFFLELDAGDVIEISAMARVRNGGVGKILAVVSGTKAEVHATSRDWERISTIYSHPREIANKTTVRISFGNFTADGGEVDFTEPCVKVIRSARGVARTHAMGFIQVLSGAPQILSSYASVGIESLSYSGTTLKVKTKPTTGAAFTRPIVTTDVVIGGSLGTEKYTLKFSAYSDVTGEISLDFIDTTTGTKFDVSGIADIRVMFKADIT